ncbi:hypothetical protein ACF090_10355 [Streptomyces sp. NPDC014892]|uniref:hypothetical protein n=1 Tax=Streptomyces sp. NPDC014892 TaxID=3364930 RepID=UPI0036F7EDE9
MVLLTRMDGASTSVDAEALSKALLAAYDELPARHAPVHGELYAPGRATRRSRRAALPHRVTHAALKST